MMTQTPVSRSQNRNALLPHSWLFLSAALLFSACATSSAADKGASSATVETSTPKGAEKECCKKKAKGSAEGEDAAGKSFRCEQCPKGEGECSKCGTGECPKCAEGAKGKCSKCVKAKGGDEAKGECSKKKKAKCSECVGAEGSADSGQPCSKCSKCAKGEGKEGECPKCAKGEHSKKKCSKCVGGKDSAASDMPCSKRVGGEGTEGAEGKCPKCASAECPHGEKCGKGKQGKDNASVPEGAKVVSVDEAQALHHSGKATFVDVNGKGVRSKQGIVPGAILLTSSSAYDLAELPKDKDTTLIFYCANTRCTAAPSAAEKAVEAGYTQVHVLSAGIAGWREANLKTEQVSR